MRRLVTDGTQTHFTFRSCSIIEFFPAVTRTTEQIILKKRKKRKERLCSVVAVCCGMQIPVD
jgi:predicted nuclease with RNAse H fold